MLKFLQHQLFRSLKDWEVSSLQCMQRRFTRREKDCFMPKGIKQSPLDKVLLKSAEKYIRFSSKDCTWLKFKFEGDNTPIIIQPPCYSASKVCHSPDDEEDTQRTFKIVLMMKRIQEAVMNTKNDLEEEYQAKALLAKSKRFFKKGTQRFSSAKATDQIECHKCGKKCHFARDCWSKTSVPSYQLPFQPKLLLSSGKKPKMRNPKDFEAKYNKVKAKLALLSSSASAPSSSSSKGLIAESYDWDEEEVSSDDEETEAKALMVLTDEERIYVGKESARNSEWTKITINKCINEQIPTQKKKLLGIRQLTEDTSSCGSKDLVFVKSLADNSDMSINSSNLHKSSEAEDFTLPNHDTDEKLDGVEPGSGPKTVKSILKSKSTFKAKTLKGITLNKPSSASARGNKSSSASKTNSAPAGKLKNVKVEDDNPLAMVMKELNELKLQISKKKSSYSRNKNTQQVPLNALKNKYKTQFKMNYKLCRQNNHLSENCYEVLFCKKCKRTNHRTCDHAEFMSFIHTNQHHTGQGESSSRSKPSRPSISFPSCMHYGYKNHHSDDCLYYPTCEICGSYDHNMIISQRRGINPRNPQHVTKKCKTCGSNVHTISDHNDIEWFRKRETPHAKKAESSNALRSKTPTKRWVSRQN
ncbi:retrovirus-related pol polyprotein from transposon TNT 1-94 [Tanacetum coccineum]